MWGKKGKIKVTQRMGDYVRKEECGERKSISEFHIYLRGGEAGRIRTLWWGNKNVVCILFLKQS